MIAKKKKINSGWQKHARLLEEYRMFLYKKWCYLENLASKSLDSTTKSPASDEPDTKTIPTEEYIDGCPSYSVFNRQQRKILSNLLKKEDLDVITFKEAAQFMNQDKREYGILL